MAIISPVWTIAGKLIDLSNCDKEPIHHIGSIQLHGCLLILQLPSWKIIQASENVSSYLGVATSDLLGQSFLEWLGQNEEDRFKVQLKASVDAKEVRTLRLLLKLPRGLQNFTVSLHQLADSQGVVLELELADEHDPLLSYIDFYDQFTKSTFAIQHATTLESLCESTVLEVRKITGFDRVWIHRVMEEGHLKVIAEDKRADLDPYLGLQFPKTDIPKQARRLYVLNRLRLISDVNSKPSILIPEMSPITFKPVDLSLSFLRAVSPVHIEYLKNTNIQASMSISLVKNGELWGLISCHHNSPLLLDYQKRAACEFIGWIVSLQIPIIEAREQAKEELELRKHLLEVLKLMTAPDVPTLLSAFNDEKDHFLKLANSDGAAICIRNEKPLVLGQAPSLEAVETLSNFVMGQDHLAIFSTDELPKVFPLSQAWSAQASGLLAVSLSEQEKFVVMWFRAEQNQIIPWGVRKPLVPSENGELRPRKSFELWNEKVRGKSLPWLASEKQMVAEFRYSFMTLVIQRAKELSKLNLDLNRSNEELDTFAYVASHDLKEPLRGIHTYATFLIEDYGDKLDEEGKKKLNRLLTMTNRMDALIESLLLFARVGRMELELKKTDLNELLKESIDSLRHRLDSANAKVEVIGKLPILFCDPIRITEVFHNLIINAMKYNNHDQKLIEIGSLRQNGPTGETEDVIYIRDNGIGIDSKYHELVFQIFKRLHPQDKYDGGSGAGLTIVKKVIDRHGGRFWLDSTLGEGTTFYFTLDSGHSRDQHKDVK